MSSARAAVLGTLAAAALAIALAARPAELRPVMPEVDGVHPVRALLALRTAYAPGGGFLDKYPPLGSFLLGIAVAAGGAPGLSARAETIVSAPPEARRAELWALRDEVAASLARERWLSRLAMGGAAAVVFLLGRRLARDACAGNSWALAGPWAAAVLFAVSPVSRVYAGTANVDALALLAALLAVLLLLHGRWATAGVLLAAAVTIKDPHVALVPVVLGGAAWLGGRRALLRAALASAAGYALLSGALTGPGVWSAHVAYLSGGGVEGVGGIDHGDPAAWGRLLLRVAGLTFGGAGSMIVLFVVFGPRRGDSAGREWCVGLAAALAPILFFILPVGFAYARFLLPTVALLLALFGAGAARGLQAVRAFAPMVARPAALLLLVLVGVLGVLNLATVREPADARAETPALLDALVPAGGRALLFADAREHGPPLDPARWALEARGLEEVGPALAALRGAPPEQRPDVVIVMGFPNAPPSGAPETEAPEPRRGERVGGLYEVADVLRAPRDWLHHEIAWSPDITLLRRIDDAGGR